VNSAEARSTAAGRLYMLPVPLTAADDPAGTATLPPATLAVAHRLDLFLAERAKTARAMLKRMGHPRPIAELTIVEIGSHPDPARLPEWLAPIVAGRDAAVLSEAGCPGIADPGADLVAAAHRAGIAVVPLVGPSSLLLALMASGANGQSFRFVGYLPQDRVALGEAIRAVQAQAAGGETQLLIETPYRNDRMLDALLADLTPTTCVTVAVDLTGAEATVAHGTVAQWRTGQVNRPPLHRRPAVFVVAVPLPRR
jgi:16S rRNA (cytidine1402-2'-O)-methyltransferase